MVMCLPLVKYTGPIELVETKEALDNAMAEISRETLLGFDTETRPNFTRSKTYPVSILQLAGAQKVWIIRLDPLAEYLPQIYSCLENPAICKAGLAVQGDIRSLRARCAFNPAGFFDISSVTSRIGVINTGMRNLTALLFGERLSKAAQLTNWASPELTRKQIEYAATDAWISRRLCVEVRRITAENRAVIAPEPEPEKRRASLRILVKNFLGKLMHAPAGGRQGTRKSTTSKKGGVKRVSLGGKIRKLLFKPEPQPRKTPRGRRRRGSPKGGCTGKNYGTSGAAASANAVSERGKPNSDK